MMGSMKVQDQLPRRMCWPPEHDQQITSLSLGCKRFRRLAPRISDGGASPLSAAFDLKSFIRPDSGPRKITSSADSNKRDPPQAESHPGGTRWNPTQEQIQILETLYKGGMRTPNAQQIEQITAQLGKFGKIEGKNVFYWFQNHKARERQRLKRNNLGRQSINSPRSTTTTTSVSLEINKGRAAEKEEDGPWKRRCRSWFESLQEVQSMPCKEEEEEEEEDDVENRTLELFPLHPEGR